MRSFFTFFCAVWLLSLMSANVLAQDKDKTSAKREAAKKSLVIDDPTIEDVSPLMNSQPPIDVTEDVTKGLLVNDPPDVESKPKEDEKQSAKSPENQKGPSGARLESKTDDDGATTIIIKGPDEIPEPPAYYSAIAKTTAKIGSTRVNQTVDVSISMIQGNAFVVSLGINGDGDVETVKGECLQSWAVRRTGALRFLDLTLKPNSANRRLQVKLKSSPYNLKKPARIQLTHLSKGDAISFDSVVDLQNDRNVDVSVTNAQGFVPLKSSSGKPSFQSPTGGKIQLNLKAAGPARDPIELSETTLHGEVHSNGNSILFRYQTTAEVTEANAEITVLSGNAAFSDIPKNSDFQLKLATEGKRAVYKLKFSKVGSFSVSLDFVAALQVDTSAERSMDFSVASSAVVPLSLANLPGDLQFPSSKDSVVPSRRGDKWVGFLPVSGRAKMSWKAARKTGDARLFFSSTGRIDTTLGAGLLRQLHQIEYQILQGELNSIRMLLQGPGEILDVQGNHIIGWKVMDQGEDRILEATLSQPMTGTSQIAIRTQTALDALPVKVEGLRLLPIGSVRYSGFLRLANSGSVRLEPIELRGLTQLAPEQFPGEQLKTRQTFVYRFPAADHAFTIAADRIEPEVSVAELVVYRLAETDRVISADIEFDIREASIRDWEFRIPSDYSVVSVTGAGVADYIPSTTVAEGYRNLKIVFSKDVIGRQLVSLQLEKSEVASAGSWALPSIQYPEAKTIRGSIGIVGAAGYRISALETDLLVEKPLSYFPKSSPLLQQAYRIREPGWSATMQIEVLERSIQADVFHLYSLSEETVYGSALVNYFVTGAPVSEWKITVPEALGNVMVDGQDVRTWRREGDSLIVSLHQPVMGAYTLLMTFEEEPDPATSSFQPGQITPLDVQGERGYIQVVSPMQVEIESVAESEDLLKLNALELPAEFRLLSTAPSLGTWQYTDRPVELTLKVNWFEAGSMVTQVVEYSEAKSQVSQDGELVTDILYYVKSRGRRTFRIKTPSDPVKLWAVSVNGQPVTAHRSEDDTLIPLPGGTDPNIPIEVRLRLGKPAINGSRPDLELPVISCPVLKTEWNVAGAEHHVLVPTGGTVAPARPVLRPSGFDWLARCGILSLLGIYFFASISFFSQNTSAAIRTLRLLTLMIAIYLSVQTGITASTQTGNLSALQLSLPILSAGEHVQLQVNNMASWRADFSWIGLVAGLAGIMVLGISIRSKDSSLRLPTISAGIMLVSLAILMQGAGAPWFFYATGLAIFVLLFLRPAITGLRDFGRWCMTLAKKRRERKDKQPAATEEDSTPAAGAATTAIAFVLVSISSCGNGFAAAPDDFKVADSVTQSWNVTHGDSKLTVSGSIILTGKPGDRFVLLKSPAVLTNFDGKGLRLSKQNLPDAGLAYVITVPLLDGSAHNSRTFNATFEYQLGATTLAKLPVLTGMATLQRVKLQYDEPGWEVIGESVVRIEQIESNAESTRASILLGPGSTSIGLKPGARDVSSEETQFFVEATNLFLPGPGVVDGRHLFKIRTSQGQVRELKVNVPIGLTVSDVSGPVGAWRFDADAGELALEIEPAQSKAFEIAIETQRGLDPLPADVSVAPLRIAGATGEVGLVGIAFGVEAQPESLVADGLSAGNVEDFDSSLLQGQAAVLHRVYRYGAEGGTLDVRVAPVDSEVRVTSNQVLSLGDERIVLGVNFVAEISRAGLFQLSFPLPDDLEVESLSGSSLHHWAELTEDGSRRIILHLNGKTIGTQKFALALSGVTPNNAAAWQIPRFELNEATRQSGQLVVRPTTGIRLRTETRQNVSEADPRTMGGTGPGALAFRLLQKNWELTLGIERLNPWVTGQVLHEVTIREGQTRTAVMANFVVQNASVNSLLVELPVDGDEEIKTIRATGSTVSDLVRTDPDSNIWEVQLKRRVVGKLQFQIEYERRGDRANETESLVPAEFPGARQLSYYFAVRAGGRLELAHDALSEGWQRIDWNAVPQSLRQSENRNAPAPALAFRAIAPAKGLAIESKRHSLAESLKLRVTRGTLTTVLSSTGDQLTSVEVQMKVIQRSSLSVDLPNDGELFSIFVNGESVNSIRVAKKANRWQFYILPGIDDQTAQVRFVYSVPGDRLSSLKLISPKLSVPLENIEWSVIAPNGYQLNHDDGNMELIGQKKQQSYDRMSYLKQVSGMRQIHAQRAAELLAQANQLLQAGEQSKASWALNSVANQYALDAASNEDARVQLENLHTQQAIVGLNSRRQRLYLDNSRHDEDAVQNQQLRQAAVDNPILQQDELNFRPQQLSQLLRGNTTADNAILQQIAGRLVRHQHTTEPAPQAIIISLPEEGEVSTFGRSIQVAEDATLQLDLDYGSKRKLYLWRILLTLVLLAGVGTAFGFALTQGKKSPE